MDILTIGDSAIDQYMKIGGDDVAAEGAKICFYHGSKILAESFETAVAGNAVNVAIGTKLLGLKSAIYTEIGGDENAERVVTALKSAGVDTKWCVKNKGTPTNVHTVVIYGGERTIFSYHEQRKYKVQKWETPKIIYFTSLPEGFEQFQNALVDYVGKNRGLIFAFNPGTAHFKMGVKAFENVLKITDILIVNKEEAEKICEGRASNSENDEAGEGLHRALHALGPKVSVITNGKNKISGFDGNTFVEVPPYSDDRPVVDKTGAGDAFSAGFLAAIYYKKSLKDALMWGAVNAGSEIKEIGATRGLLDKDKLEKTLRSFN